MTRAIVASFSCPRAAEQASEVLADLGYGREAMQLTPTRIDDRAETTGDCVELIAGWMVEHVQGAGLGEYPGMYQEPERLFDSFGNSSTVKVEAPSMASVTNLTVVVERTADFKRVIEVLTSSEAVDIDVDPPDLFTQGH
jgi:hypothetical protein